jgi:hypothetical protein
MEILAKDQTNYEIALAACIPGPVCRAAGGKAPLPGPGLYDMEIMI